MYGITFFNRDFTLRPQPPINVTVERLQWSAEGGPEVAQLTAAAGDSSLVQLLRSPVEVWSKQGRVVWWGYVEAVQIGDLRFDISLMANHVQAMYTFAVNEGPVTTVQKLYTDWASDLGSQADFGRKDRILAVGAITQEQAESRVEQTLAEHGRPRPALQPGKELTLITLTCRGWYATLGWNYYSNLAGLAAYTISGTGAIPVNGTSRPNLAQSFQVPTAGWDLADVWFNVSKHKEPTDNLLLTLAADDGGTPGGTVLASSSLAAAEVGKDYAWIKFTFSPAVTLGSGIYWLVFGRSGDYDTTNYFNLKANETCGYADGHLLELLRGDWTPYDPDADLNFMAQGSQGSTDQIAAVVADPDCGQFLTGSRIEQASSLYSCQYCDGSKTGLQVVKGLLASGDSAGNGLVALVDAGRVLHIRSKTNAAQLTQGSDGMVRDAYGQAVAEDGIVAQWVRIERPGLELAEAQFITRVQADAEGKITLFSP